MLKNMDYELVSPCGIYCAECSLYRANALPHNLKMFSQCFRKRYGVKAWIEQLPLIHKHYFTGKIGYGKGPQLEGEE